MSFKKYGIKDNADGILLAGIGLSDTTINLNSGDGARFAQSNTILTLVQFNTQGDPSSGIIKFEKILVGSISGDTLNSVTRGFDGSSASSFDAGDSIYCNVTALTIQDIQDEIERLEDDKLNKSGELRTNLTAFKLIYINASGEETVFDLGDSGRVLQSNGANSIPSWVVPTVDINGLSSELNIVDNDEFIFYDLSSGENKKITFENLKKFFNTGDYISSINITKASNSSGSGTGEILGSIPANTKIINIDIHKRNSGNSWRFSNSGVIYNDGNGIQKVYGQYSPNFWADVYVDGSNIKLDWNIGNDDTPVDYLDINIDFRK